ncbi:hypothetical protein DERP_013079 [Dermatophagoides pteronyssinus]|uniref:Uncharacterized protein n=1 Tax=Dermatophagoides pteronyssinus TaxID=6956 RepID=A0ABQ8JPW6_DERPT|nr:hypothetical protein DERP_013079 [Dermatophagoides pteronyssinus]
MVHEIDITRISSPIRRRLYRMMDIILRDTTNSFNIFINTNNNNNYNYNSNYNININQTDSTIFQYLLYNDKQQLTTTTSHTNDLNSLQFQAILNNASAFIMYFYYHLHYFLLPTEYLFQFYKWMLSIITALLSYSLNDHYVTLVFMNNNNNNDGIINLVQQHYHLQMVYIICLLLIIFVRLFFAEDISCIRIIRTMENWLPQQLAHDGWSISILNSTAIFDNCKHLSAVVVKHLLLHFLVWTHHTISTTLFGGGGIGIEGIITALIYMPMIDAFVPSMWEQLDDYVCYVREITGTPLEFCFRYISA